MPKKEINILAINPGTKYIGLAVFQGEDLNYWGIKVFKGKWSKEKLEQIKKTLLNLIEQYDISTLILKKLHRSRSSGNLNQLVKAIESLAKKKKLKISIYRLETIRDVLTEGGGINKMDVAELVVERYSFLESYLMKEGENKRPYFIRMFEAIAAGLSSIH